LDGCLPRQADAAPRDMRVSNDAPVSTDTRVLDDCIPEPELCDGADQDCDGRLDEGAGCEGCPPGFGDCDGSAANGCETPLNTSTDCGGCAVRCGGGDACEVNPGTCDDGTCTYALAAAGTVCRASTCAADAPESCDGTAATCPPPCGCEGEPCCGGACAFPLTCIDDVCEPCMTTTPAVNGTAGIMGMSFFANVSASGSTISFTSTGTGPGGSITLGGGVTVSGAFNATNSGYLTSISASGNQLTFTDRDGVSGSLTFSGATLSGGGSSPIITFPGGSIPGLIQRAVGVGNRIEFYSSTNVRFAEITLTGGVLCP
ncbi:MAG: hypothetical protein AAF645_21620, partial [Myxococcota bacterium]